MHGYRGLRDPGLMTPASIADGGPLITTVKSLGGGGVVPVIVNMGLFVFHKIFLARIFTQGNS